MKQNIALGVTVLASILAAFALQPTPALFSLGSAGNAGALSAAPASGLPEGNSQDMAKKLMMPNPFTYNFVAGEALSDESGTGSVYQLVLTGDAESVLLKVSKALGVPGQIERPEYSTDEYPMLVVGAQDGMAKSAAISWSGTGNWWFNDPAAYPIPDCLEFSTAEDGTKYCIQYQNPKLESQPTKTQIIAEAIRVFSATGLLVRASEVVTNSNEWGSSAYASLQIDGQDSPIEWSLGWSTNGTLAYASGHSVKLVKKGEFKTISARDSVKRISDWRYSGSIAQALWSKYQPINMDLTPQLAVEPYIESSPDSSTDSSPDSSTDSSPSPLPLPSPSIVNVTINRAVSALVMIWDQGGNAWIVPGTILIGDQGWLTPVFTLEDGVIALPAPMENLPDVSPMLK